MWGLEGVKNSTFLGKAGCPMLLISPDATTTLDAPLFAGFAKGGSPTISKRETKKN